MASRSAIGTLLKEWRAHRRISQLDLAVRTGVSQRHLSFVETGRSRPSRELVLHLAEGLDVPLRDRNVLLQAAGFAPVYRETAFDAPELEPVRRAISLMVDRHDPFPAVVIDRHWNLLQANPGATALTAAFAAPEAISRSRGNLLRLLMDPQGFRPHIVNLDETIRATRTRLDREMATDPRDPTLRDLVDEVFAEFSNVDGHRGVAPPSTASELVYVLPLHLRSDDAELRLFSTLATIGSPLDITVQETVIELFYPADASTEAFFGEVPARRDSGN